MGKKPPIGEFVGVGEPIPASIFCICDGVRMYSLVFAIANPAPGGIFADSIDAAFSSAGINPSIPESKLGICPRNIEGIAWEFGDADFFSPPPIMPPIAPEMALPTLAIVLGINPFIASPT